MSPACIQARIAIIGAVIVSNLHRLVDARMRGVNVIPGKCAVGLCIVLPQLPGHVENVILPDVLVHLDDVGLVVADTGCKAYVVVIERVRRSRCWALVRCRIPRHHGLSYRVDLVRGNDVRGSDQHRIALRAGARSWTIAVLITADCRVSASVSTVVGVVGRAGSLCRWVVNCLVVSGSVDGQAQQAAEVASGHRRCRNTRERRCN